MMDAVKKYSGVDFTEVKTDEEAKKLADEHHVAYEARHKKVTSSISSSKNSVKTR